MTVYSMVPIFVLPAIIFTGLGIFPEPLPSDASY
jgi:hypothetical protein